MKSAVWWIRRDLRLADNQALASALAQAENVVPVFVLDPALLRSRWVGANRLAFLLGGLSRLDSDLRARASRLIVRQGNPRDELATLLAETGSEAIYAEEDYTPYARRRDASVAGRLPLHLISSLTVHPPAVISKADGTPYTVFTPFSRAWKALSPAPANSIIPAPTRIPTPANIEGLPIPAEPALPPNVTFPPGEAEAQARLSAFVDGDDPAGLQRGRRKRAGERNR